MNELILGRKMGSSPPPTPPPMGRAKSEWRFKSMHSACECIEDYQPGGYHPVHLGDMLHNEQYKVVRKLGEGGFSTVWLAHDLEYVALKIMIANAEPTSELDILRHVQHHAPEECTRHVTRFLTEFEHTGPNGTHRCLVFEPMGPNVNVMKEELPQFKIWTPNQRVRYPPAMAKRILRNTLEAVEFLHNQGISHGDLQPGNMLFALNDINAVPEEQLRQLEDDDIWTGTISKPVERLDGKKDLWAPRYLCNAQSLAPFTTYDESHLQVKLSDMGGAFFWDQPPEKIITPMGLSPPEHLFYETIHKSLDTWSFGCLLFELLAGQPLFMIWGGKGQEDDLTVKFSEAIGPLPDEMFQRWTNSHLYFNEERELYNIQVGGPDKDNGPMPPQERQLMEERFDDCKVEINEEEATTIKRLIRRILQYDPEKRPSATEILQDPWFQYFEPAQDVISREDTSEQQSHGVEENLNTSGGPGTTETDKNRGGQKEVSESNGLADENDKDEMDAAAQEAGLATEANLTPQATAPKET